MILTGQPHAHSLGLKLPVALWQLRILSDNHYATFAVSPSGYMDDNLGLLYTSKHFVPHTRSPGAGSGTAGAGTVDTAANRPRILIINDHSSHIC